MNSTKPEQLRKRLRRNDQQGFTLIELLVVISILGILAAVVTMSLVGITTRAQNQANATELRTVQAAFDTMLADPVNQTVNPTTLCATGGGGPTKDMSTFPTSHALYPNYIRQHDTSQNYSCTGNGQVTSP